MGVCACVFASYVCVCMCVCVHVCVRVCVFVHACERACFLLFCGGEGYIQDEYLVYIYVWWKLILKRFSSL